MLPSKDILISQFKVSDETNKQNYLAQLTTLKFDFAYEIELEALAISIDPLQSLLTPIGQTLMISPGLLQWPIQEN